MSRTDAENRLDSINNICCINFLCVLLVSNSMFPDEFLRNSILIVFT